MYIHACVWYETQLGKFEYWLNNTKDYFRCDEHMLSLNVLEKIFEL